MTGVAVRSSAWLGFTVNFTTDNQQPETKNKMNTTAYNPRVAGGLATGMAMTATQVNTCQPVEAPQINEQACALETVIEDTRRVFGELYERCSSILRPPQPEPGSGSAACPRVSIAPMAERLRASVDQLSELNAGIRHMLGRVEL